MLKQFWNDELFQPMDRRYFRLIDRSGGALGLLSDDFRAGYRPEALFSRFQHTFNHPETSSYYNKMTHFDMVTTLPALLQVEDRVSMAVSLESRVPLLDHRLADLVASMPPAMKFRGGEMKYILKRAVQHTLPPRILERKDKMGFRCRCCTCGPRAAPATLPRHFSCPSVAGSGESSTPPVRRQLLGKEEVLLAPLGAPEPELWHRQFGGRRLTLTRRDRCRSRPENDKVTS
jgi:asparagine synthase (glutamine-hydrolysing)